MAGSPSVTLCCHTKSPAGPPSSSRPQLGFRNELLGSRVDSKEPASAAIHPDCLISGGEDPVSGLAGQESERTCRQQCSNHELMLTPKTYCDMRLSRAQQCVSGL